MYKSKITNTIKYSVLLLALICVFQIPTKASAAVTTGTEFTENYDSVIIDVTIYIFQKMTHLFTIFPLNVVMIASICGIAFGLLGRAKRTVTNK